MPKQKLKCHCRPNYKCLAPLHGKIEIVICKKGCKLGCDK